MSDFPREQLAERVAALAKDGIYVGTSSWKYEGWLGLIYSHEKYLRYFKNNNPPRLQKERFERTCLAEYAQTFKTVCADATYYQFPSTKLLDSYFAQVPDDFRMSFKVTKDITIKKFPNHPDYGDRAGKINDHFLDVELFATNFLAPLGPYRDRVGTLFFEFSRFYPGEWETGRQFVAYLDAFLDKLPKDWDFSVEIRNESFLHPRYFEALQLNRAAHTFNSWTHMPPVDEQMQMIGVETADFCSARLLVRPGRTKQQAVEAFMPYSEIKEPNKEARASLAKLLSRSAFQKARRRYIYVNNRLEGNAPWTIVAALEAALVGTNGTEKK